MKKLNLFLAILGIGGLVNAQNVVNRVWEYKPAPGQHINIESVGTPQAAQNMPKEMANIVSLGSFGGYIILGFEYACVNDAENPYGIDFTIFGNAFSGSAEPGVVWVMKDKNQNGLPDDTWYEIKGSQHFHSGSVENYQVTYFKTETRDVYWKDNRENTGTIKANSYNTQEYYPAAVNFPDYPQDSVVFEGTLLAPAIDSSNPAQLVTEPFDFGYADVRAVKQGVDLSIPDNPYSDEVEGAGGNPVDISWAVDSEGNYVDLDAVHFIKVATANLASIGWLGEISTDVAYVADVEKNKEITGENELLVVYHHKSKIIAGETLQLEAKYFLNGRPLESTFTFVSQNTNVASVNSAGEITTKNNGETEISVSSNGKTKTTLLTVVTPDSIEVLSDFSSVYPGDSVLLEANVFDNNGDKLFVEIQYSIENQSLGKIIEAGGKSYFVASESGETSVTFRVDGFTEKTVRFKIGSQSDLVGIYFSVKTENENLFPLQKIKVGTTDFSNFVENRTNNYSGEEHHSLAHAVVAGLQKAGLGFSLRDDENSGGELYLYSVEKEGEFVYGWGGKTSPEAFAKAWVVCKNSTHYFNNFDEIAIAQEDTIVLYHVSDIVHPWIFTRMVSNKDSAVVNDEIEITLEQTTCSQVGGIIAETDFIPIQNHEITAGEASYFSDENGKAAILVTSAPPLLVSSGNDAVLISNKIVTSSIDFAESDIQIYPNPAEKELIVNGPDLVGTQMYIYDLNGKNIWSESVFTSNKTVDVQFFTPGIYVLKIVGKSAGKTVKFIKK
ncbi:MAG: T9SS type A sorting domain-containing protein [Prolixibacteraceae bacterium]|nr:T9SS type A sorting domain-containing protein [Prolixibacteraceae bacterium]